jgi:hypothetical protein
VWESILGFGKPSSFSNEPKIELIVESPSLVSSISRGGDLGKSGPGPDATQYYKTGTRSIFVNGFLPHHYHTNTPLSCKTGAKLSKNQFQPKDDGSDIYNQNGTSKFDPRDYKGG